MQDYIVKRVLDIAAYITDTRSTVRAAAAMYGVSKSTVHTDMSVRLPKLDEELHRQVQEILDYNFSVRHIRGGESTHNKYVR